MIWIGDIHGCHRTFVKLLKKLPRNSKIGLLGDLISKGPDSLKVIQTALDFADVIVCGNHEQKMFIAMSHVIGNDLNEGHYPVWGSELPKFNFMLSDSYTEGLIKELHERVVVCHINSRVVAVHGSCSFNFDTELFNDKELIKELTSDDLMHKALRSPDKYSEDNAMMWMRDFDSSEAMGERLDRKVIHGHSVTKSGKVTHDGHIVFVDTGCYKGSNYTLSAYDDKTGEVWIQKYAG